MQIFYYNSKQQDTNLAIEISILLNQNKIGIIPTDTVYGIAGKLGDLSVKNNLFKIKKRSEDKIFVLQDKDTCSTIKYFDFKDKNLLKFFLNKFWPGALTVIAKASNVLLEYYKWNYDTVAMRVPKHDLVLEILRLVKDPLMVTSANISNQPLPKSVEEMLELFKDKVDFIVIDDKDYKTVPSTIIDVTKGNIKFLREGVISKEEVEKEYKVLMR